MSGHPPRSSVSSGASSGLHGAVELDHLALQEVDARVGSACSSLEDLLLDLLDVVVDPVDDREVVVDDLVEDRPDRRRGPELEQVGALLELAPRAACSSLAGPVADGDHVAAGRANSVDLAELDLLALLVVARGPQDDEEVLVVVLDLRPLVGLVRVLDAPARAARKLADSRSSSPGARARGARSRRTRPRRTCAELAPPARACSASSCWRTPSL